MVGGFQGKGSLYLKFTLPRARDIRPRSAGHFSGPLDPAAVGTGPIARRGTGLYARENHSPTAGGVGVSGTPSGRAPWGTVRRRRGAVHGPARCITASTSREYPFRSSKK